MKINQDWLGGLTATIAIMALSVSANATLITGTIANNNNNYSLVHAGIDPMNPGDPDDFLFFEDGAVFTFDLTGGIVTTSGSQSYALMSDNGASSIFSIDSLFIDTNNAMGFAGGSLDYTLDGTSGTFVFDPVQFLSTNFNSSSFDGTTFLAYAWGADIANDFSLDLVFTGTVPEPGTLALISLGLLALGARGLRHRAR